MGSKERHLGEKELSPAAEILARRFIQRWDMYPRQLDDGRYVTIHEPLNIGLLFDHLRGEITLGTYLLNPESNGRFLVLDADDEPQWFQLQTLARSLAEESATAYLEASRRGGHLWLFLEEPRPGRELRDFGKGLLAVHEIEEMEVFPKQNELGEGPGSLIRLPFGLHRVTGQRYGFYTSDGQPLAINVREQIALLSRPEWVPENVFKKYEGYLSTFPGVNGPQNASGGARDRVLTGEDTPDFLSERIKDSVGIRDFISQYVQLSSSGQGLCPFHDDHHPSFAINEEGNFWHCFAGCGGGSVIDFWMKYRDCDFTEAVAELAGILLN